jgi:hypothetical protein
MTDDDDPPPQPLADPDPPPPVLVMANWQGVPLEPDEPDPFGVDPDETIALTPADE